MLEVEERSRESIIQIISIRRDRPRERDTCPPVVDSRNERVLSTTSVPLIIITRVIL